MKAIVYTGYGPPDVLRLEEVPKPAPGEDQVLVKVRAASVNFANPSLARDRSPRLSGRRATACVAPGTWKWCARLMAILLIACTMLTSGVACSAPGSTLEENKWILQSHGEQNSLTTVLAGTEITATFDDRDSEVSGSGGCNTYFASYEIDGDALFISELAWTERGCISPPGIMEQEQEYLSLLADAESFQVDDASLTITCSDGKLLHFSATSGTE